MWQGHRARWLQSVTVCAVLALLTPGKVSADDFDLGTCEQARGTYQGVLDAGDPTFGRPTSIDVFPPFGTGTPSCSTADIHEYDSYTFNATAGSVVLQEIGD